MLRPKALILMATGTNRDGDAAQALGLAGAEPVILPIKQLRLSGLSWKEYQLLVIPGGFSYADALGAGKLLALDLVHYFTDQVSSFVADGKPVIGICNGFQALVKAGILQGAGSSKATLTYNASGHFECRWVTLNPLSQVCLWTKGLNEPIECPVAHGEGKFVLEEPLEAELEDGGQKPVPGASSTGVFPPEQVALVYAGPGGKHAYGLYPYNPNGSILDIAGICNPAGNVLGMMPHPENHVLAYQRPSWQQGVKHSGLPLFKNGVEYATA